MKKEQSIGMKIWTNHYFRFVLFGLMLSMLVPAVSGGILKTSFLGIVGGTIIFTIAALGLNILLGYSGLISLGTAGFMAYIPNHLHLAATKWLYRNKPNIFVASASMLGDMRQRVRAKLPAAVTVCGDINKPRYATPINIMKASKKPRSTWNAADLGCEASRIGVPGSPSSTKGLFEPEKHNADTVYFTGELDAMIKAFADMLQSEHII